MSVSFLAHDFQSDETVFRKSALRRCAMHIILSLWNERTQKRCSSYIWNAERGRGIEYVLSHAVKLEAKLWAGAALQSSTIKNWFPGQLKDRRERSLQWCTLWNKSVICAVPEAFRYKTFCADELQSCPAKFDCNLELPVISQNISSHW